MTTDEIKDLQNDLFEMGFDPGPADGVEGPRTRKAIEAFRASHRVGGRITAIALSCMQGLKNRQPPWGPIERRVKVGTYGALERGDPRLVPVAGTKGKPRLLHHVAAGKLEHLLEAAAEFGFHDILVASGHRRHRWASWKDYARKMVAKYGSVREGRKWMAFDSPHETGLAVDFGSHGLFPARRTRAKQKTEPLYKWLCEHAWRYGCHPYLREPWHWEFPLSDREFTTTREK